MLSDAEDKKPVGATRPYGRWWSSYDRLYFGDRILTSRSTSLLDNGVDRQARGVCICSLATILRQVRGDRIRDAGATGDLLVCHAFDDADDDSRSRTSWLLTLAGDSSAGCTIFRRTHSLRIVDRDRLVGTERRGVGHRQLVGASTAGSSHLPAPAAAAAYRVPATRSD